MKSKMRKKLIAFMLCMVLVICNSVSILADTPAAETTTAGEQVKETRTAKNENASDDKTGGEDEKNVSKQSEESDKDTPPEVTTTEKKKETTETTTEKKEETTTEASTEKEDPDKADEVTTEAKEETTEASKEKTTEKATTEAAEETSTTGEKEETDETEESSETSETTTETTEETSTKTTEASTEMTEETAQSPAFDGKYEDETVIISVNAEAGIVPEGAELSVTPIEKTEITDDMSEEAKAEAEQINAQYDLTEKKLTEDSEANEETMEGFLAYDISFIVDGEEVEPSGDVKVVMDFKEAAIPEGVSETADISVKHLKEDATAEDGVVIEDMAEKTDVQTTDKAEVEKVEFTAESFSIYTVTWYGNELVIHVVDSNGKPYPNTTEGEKSYNFSDQKVVDVNTIAEDIRNEFSIENRVDFNKAVIVDKEEDFSFAATQIYGLMYKDDGFWRCTDTNINGTSGWGAIRDRVIYFIFGDDPTLTTESVKTVSTKDTIDINLFDYQVGYNGDESADWNNSSGINNGHALKFVDDKGENHTTININQTGSKGYINSNMVQSKLSNGFPVLQNPDGGDGESLDYLFNSNTNNSKRVYSNLDQLFEIDENGYHVFNSEYNYAYLPYDSDSKTFSENFSVVNIGGMESPGFYPFSQPNYDTLTKIKQSSQEAVLGYTGVNHYYGMTIETTFIQPKGGQITTTGGTNQDMIFEFSGDDDVWVFIDDVLVLDLGGIHGKVSGTINFATGQVTRTDINDGYAAGTTIRKAFEDAGVTGDLKTETNTFSDYTTHTIKFFYLERGNVDSNCMIKFNFPTIPKDSVTVAKEVTANGQSIDYADDIDFEFNIKVNDGNYSNQSYSLWKNGQQVLDEEGNPVTGRTDSNGNFTLKHSQMAVFDDLDENMNYQVTELGAYLNGYQVYIDEVEHQVNPGSSTDESIANVQTGELTVGEDRDVIFRNDIKNRATLSIEKKLKEGEALTNQPFQIEVKIQGEPYEGTYSIGTQDDIPAQDGISAQEGIIKPKANETAQIKGLPYGVDIEVEEMLNGSYQPSYSITGNADNIQVPDPNDEENTLAGASAQIIGESATVTVTNERLEQEAGTTKVTVNKTWDMTEGKYELPDSVTVTLYVDANFNGEWDNDDVKVENVNPIQLTATGSWQGEWTNLPGDIDYVVKEEYPEGYKIKTVQSSNDITSMTYLGVVTSCSNLIWPLQQNNMLVSKKGSSFTVWTLYDLKLNKTEQDQVTNWIEDAVNGTINNIQFVHGQGGFGLHSNISLIQNGDGSWRLEFGETNAWSQFYYFRYDRTQNISLTNTIDTTETKQVSVEKQWSDGNPNEHTVTIQLLPTANGDPVTLNEVECTVVLDGEEDNWKHTFSKLPYYYYSESDKQYYEISYGVTEIKINETLISEGEAIYGYVFAISGNEDTGYTIKNNKVSPWKIQKVSNTDSTIVLSDAEFTLTKQKEDGFEDYETSPSYYGKSEATGDVRWYETKDFSGLPIQYIPDGTYKLEETKAPVGYQKSDVAWIIEIENFQVANITDGEGNVINQYVPMTREAETTIIYQYENEALYSLPSAGGPGIHWYTFSGTLLMAGAALIVYRQKRKREVLLRK